MLNIKQAKEYIRDSVKLYLKKDEEGEYRIPVVRQRPIFLLGAPGIGKTAVMEQIAQELGIALVSYSMTHHTRQSALGLPFIAHREYDGFSYDVSEYTMSEIIASIYDVMQESGIREGILFLDEINCVSETLAPSMLQFLQYKVFGRHKVPEGWVIVTAGNPPEYNKSVREFDVVTLDRMKILEVEADYGVWKEYARNRNLHTAILNYLDLKKEDFYQVETTVRGKNYITARGWEDLSEMIQLCEEEGMDVEETLVEQYLRNPRVVREFTAYYGLYQKYKKDYRVEEILAGKSPADAGEKARKAGFDERLSLLGMLIDHVQRDIRENMEELDYLSGLLVHMKALRNAAAKEDGAAAQGKDTGGDAVRALLERQIEGRRKGMEALQKAGSLSDREKRKQRKIIRFLQDGEKELRLHGAPDENAAVQLLKGFYDREVMAYRGRTEETGKKMHYLFAFVEDAFGAGNEMLILLTECTVNQDSAKFISMYGSEDYKKHHAEMMVSERGDMLMRQIDLVL
ncbi:MAG: AAA family ATPase [Blautia sp.]|nr:AAA family ATPase [Blautia sp.]MCM1202347.1 AAA family ATPase [Bacteroides fragilis]